MKRVLLVDDDPDILEALSDVLTESYEVEEALNGMVALERVQSRSFDAVVLDLMMPVMDGTEFLRRVQERGIQIPVIVASAATDLSARCKGLGARECLAKPFDIDDLEAAIERAVSGGPGGGSRSPPGGSGSHTGSVSGAGWPGLGSPRGGPASMP